MFLCQQSQQDSPCYSSSQDSPVSHRGNHRCQCPARRGSRYQPIQLHTARMWIHAFYHRLCCVSVDLTCTRRLHKSCEILYSLVLFWVNFCHLTLDFALSVDDALSAGVAGVGLTIPTGSLQFAATSLIPNIAHLTGTTSEWALTTQREQAQYITECRSVSM